VYVYFNQQRALLTVTLYCKYLFHASVNDKNSSKNKFSGSLYNFPIKGKPKGKIRSLEGAKGHRMINGFVESRNEAGNGSKERSVRIHK
jgi:hypothetical protein